MSKKRIIGPVEIVAIILVLAILAYILMQNDNFSMLEKTETVEIVDNPNSDTEKKRVRSYRAGEENDRVEVILQQLADQFSAGTEVSNIEKEKISTDLSEDEMDYITEVKKEHEDEAQSIDWFAVLKASHDTYRKVKSTFSDAGIEVDLDAGQVSTVLQNEIVAQSFYRRLEETFRIPEADARRFAEKGQKAVSDWAKFVEEQQK